ncbi:hypothetical protein Fmac_021367 [Flemingia macrophylla]|uniref:Uncharacterized protein n=1 Tax=Flemingia macrophylla TaxID=520843 RepID=A0ABD1LWQ2_9FABA
MEKGNRELTLHLQMCIQDWSFRASVDTPAEEDPYPLAPWRQPLNFLYMLFLKPILGLF